MSAAGPGANLATYLLLLMFFAYFMVGALALYFIYGMRNSNLQHGDPQDDAPDMGEFPGPVIDD